MIVAVYGPQVQQAAAVQDSCGPSVRRRVRDDAKEEDSGGTRRGQWSARSWEGGGRGEELGWGRIDGVDCRGGMRRGRRGEGDGEACQPKTGVSAALC